MTEKYFSNLLTGQPTQHTSDLAKIPSIIDFCVIKGIEQAYLEVEPYLDLSLSNIIGSQELFKKFPLKLFNHNTDWDIFRFKVVEKIISASMDVSSSVRRLINRKRDLSKDGTLRALYI